MALEFDEFAMGQLQRDLGRIAARAEEGRREAEEALEVERRRAADLDRERASLADRLSAAEAVAAIERHLADEAAEAVMRRDAEIRSRAEATSLDHERQIAALHSEVDLLSRQLSEARALLAVSQVPQPSAASEAPSLAPLHRSTVEEQALTEAAKLRREVSGMSVLVEALRNKVQSHEKKLLDQARTCAEELNDMRCQVSASSGGPSGGTSDAGGLVDTDEDALSDELNLSPFELDLGINLSKLSSKLGLGGLPPSLRAALALPGEVWGGGGRPRVSGDGIDDGYAQLDDGGGGPRFGEKAPPRWISVPRLPPQGGEEARPAPLSVPPPGHDSYLPPTLPDAI